MASSQRRRVFVGNIPYGATEEQLLEICQEVGPVLSFRLVVDRETGKRKGYGFCEYRDEETALSARRNLQGYEINGRQLRVDFAENDKGADRKREQSRGGPGMAPNVDPQKKLANTAIHGESVHHHPIGLHTGITAAAAMAGALGGVQAGMQSDQNGLHSQPALANDPLTLHLAKMSRSQLNEIMSELKAMTTQNKEQAHQLLLSIPQLPKALFQAQIMLGMVTPEVMENVRQPPLRDSLLGQPPAVQTLAGLPPFAQNKMQSGMVRKVPENHSAVPQNPLVPNQFSSPQKPRIQLPQHGNNHILQPATVPGQSGVSQIQGAGSSSVNHKMQPHLLQHSGQAGPSIISGISPVINKDAEYRNAPPGSMHQGSLEPVNRPAKLMKLNDGRSHASGSLPVNLVPKAEAQYAEKQTSQSQFPPEVESVLLQQVLNLTLEQLSSLPPEEQQQVIRLQQSLRRDQILVS